MGPGSADAGAFPAAFNPVSEYTNVANGAVPGPALPSGYYASSIEINTLGDILTPCINSSGGVAGDGMACSTCFHWRSPSAELRPYERYPASKSLLRRI